MYTKDKDKILTIRLTTKQNEFISMLAEEIGTNKTNIIRGYINKAICYCKKYSPNANKSL